MKFQTGQDIIDKIRGKKIKIKDCFARKFYSQDGEDAVLYSYIMDAKNNDFKGFYVDIGALHPQRFSNTNIFYEMGWRGINIDATPGSMKKFNELRPRDINIEAVISDVNDEMVHYYEFEEPALNSFDKKLAESYIARGYKLKKVELLKTSTINNILDQYLPMGGGIDLMTIDIEGKDEQVIKSLDYQKYAPQFLVVEECKFAHNDFANYAKKSELYNFLASKNYIVIGKTMRSVIYQKLK